MVKASIAGFVSFLFLAALFLNQGSFAKVSELETLKAKKSNTIAILMQGLPEHVDVDYLVMSSSGRVMAQGNTSTDVNGKLSIIKEDGFKGLLDELIYELEIKKEGQHTKITAQLDLNTDRFKISGSGLSELSDISIETLKTNLQTKTDWSGLFSEEGIGLDQKDNSYNFKIAFNVPNNFAIGQNIQSPFIIHVHHTDYCSRFLTAPGGGGPGPGGVNEFDEAQGCDYGQSTEDRDHINDTIEAMRENYVRALMMMTEQLSAVMMQSTMAIGMFLDAKVQMEVQRTHQLGQVEAVKDYHPSEQMCQVGSFMRSVAATEQKGLANAHVLNEMLSKRYRNLTGSSTAEGGNSDMAARLKLYREVHCNITDNNAGLDYMCEHDQDGNATTGDAGGSDTERLNKDIDFFRTLEFPLTLEIDFQNTNDEDEEKDIMALAKHLYWPSAVEYPDAKSAPKQYPGFFDIQNVIALNNVAHSSFANLTGMKAMAADGDEDSGWAFMKTLLRDEFGILEEEVETMVGERPSYWAQMEVLTKKIYQNPDFYTNLYDKPTNVDRMEVALSAIQLMQMRDHYTSMLRREMQSSAMLQTELMKTQQYNSASTALAGEQ